MKPSRTAPLALAAALLAIAAPAAAGPAPPTPDKPKLVQLYYAEVDDGSSPRYRLHGHARHTESLRFKVRYRGKAAAAGSRYDKSITETDLRGEAKHPFVVRRDRGGRRALKLIRKALAKRGVAKVRVRARGEGGVDSARLRIVLSRCSLEPPFYPVDCEVRA